MGFLLLHDSNPDAICPKSLLPVLIFSSPPISYFSHQFSLKKTPQQMHVLEHVQWLDNTVFFINSIKIPLEVSACLELCRIGSLT